MRVIASKLPMVAAPVCRESAGRADTFITALPGSR